jgi:hypothetical protein
MVYASSKPEHYRISNLPSPATPPGSSSLSNFSRTSVLNASPYAAGSPSKVIYLKKPTLLSTATLMDSMPLTPPSTPLPSMHGNNHGMNLLMQSPKYRTEITILPFFSSNNNQ